MSLSRIDARADPMMISFCRQHMVRRPPQRESRCVSEAQVTQRSKDTSFFSSSRSGSLYSAAMLFVQQTPAESPSVGADELHRSHLASSPGRGATWRRRTMGVSPPKFSSEMPVGGALSHAKSFGLQEEVRRSARDRWQVAFGV